MAEKKVFKCQDCGQTVEIDPKVDSIPECCGQPMTAELPVCVTTDTAEHARFSDDGEPCDDGRSGIK